jgi:plasmid maintenance system antidote protein VapI
MRLTNWDAKGQNEFGRFIRAALARTGLDVGQLAELSGFHPVTVANIAAGGSVTERLALRLLLGFLAIRPDQLDTLNTGLAFAGYDPVPSAKDVGGVKVPGVSEATACRTFGATLEGLMTKLGVSEGRVAQLTGCDTSTISRIVAGGSVSERLAMRILLGLLHLPRIKLEFLSAGLLAAGFEPLPLPGKDVSSHEVYLRRRRGGLRGKPFGRAPR